MEHMVEYSVLVDQKITPDFLLQMAASADEQTMAGDFTSNDNFDLRRVRDRAMFAAEYMEKNGIKEAEFIGCFARRAFVSGQKVRIKAGARRFSTNPKVPRGGEIVNRSYVVEVKEAFAGYIDAFQLNRNPICNPTVRWSGTGGYWYWAYAEDVEPVE